MQLPSTVVAQHEAKQFKISVKEKLSKWWTLNSWGARWGWLGQFVETGAWEGPHIVDVGLMVHAPHVQDQLSSKPSMENCEPASQLAQIHWQEG